MAYTVKQVAAMSCVSVRTLHFYDETELLKPAYYAPNGYRFYEEPQLLMLQQILFYREAGFDLKRIRQILSRKDFDKLGALEAHCHQLRDGLARTTALLETLEKTIEHLKGTASMTSADMFTGFSVGAGKDRFDEGFDRYGTTIDCKVSGKDTGGALCVLEISNTGWPRHVNQDQDEWIYVVDGEVELEVGGKRIHLGPRESTFIPRNVEHTWGGGPAQVLNTYQPAGKIEQFFQALAAYKNLPTGEQAAQRTYTDEQIAEMKRIFEEHGMMLIGPGLV